LTADHADFTSLVPRPPARPMSPGYSLITAEDKEDMLAMLSQPAKSLSNAAGSLATASERITSAADQLSGAVSKLF